MSHNTKKLALITEGKTDQIVLTTLLSQAILNCNIEDFECQQPSDNTSGEGGWRQVYKWCLNNSPELRQRLRTGLFTTSPTYKAHIIHLDGDLCDKAEFSTTHSLDETDFDLQQAESRGQYLSAVLHEWLKTETDEPIIFALAIDSIETWLLAGLKQNSDNIEHDRDPEQTLLTVLKTDNKAQDSQKKLRKTPKNYEKLSHQAAQNIEQIKASCPHFAKLCNQISPLINSV